MGELLGFQKLNLFQGIIEKNPLRYLFFRANLVVKTGFQAPQKAPLWSSGSTAEHLHISSGVKLSGSSVMNIINWVCLSMDNIYQEYFNMENYAEIYK